MSETRFIILRDWVDNIPNATKTLEAATKEAMKLSYKHVEKVYIAEIVAEADFDPTPENVHLISYKQLEDNTDGEL